MIFLKFLLVPFLFLAPQPLAGMEKVPQELLEHVQKNACNGNHSHQPVTLKSSDNSCSYPICCNNASLSKVLKKMVQEHQKEYIYTFSSETTPVTVFLIAAYLQAESTYKELAKESIMQKCTLTKNFEDFYNVYLATKTLKIKPLEKDLNNYIFTTLMENLSTKKTELTPFYTNLYDRFGSSDKVAFTLEEPNTIKDIIISPDNQFIITTTLSPCKKYFNCCVYESKNSFLPLIIFQIDVTECTSRLMLEFSPDNIFLIIKTDKGLTFYTCSDFTQKTFDIKPTAHISTEYQSRIITFTLNHDAKTIITTTYDGLAIVYDCTTYAETLKLDFNKQRVLDKPLFTHDPTKVVIALDKECVLYSLEKDKEERKITSYKTKSPITSLHMSPDGKELIVLTEKLCAFLNTDDLELQAHVKTDAFDMVKVAFSHDSLYTAISNNSTCYIYKKGSHKIEQKYRLESDIVHLTFSPTQPYLLLFEKEGCILYNYEAKKIIKTIAINCFDGKNAIFSSDGRYLIITCNKTGKIYLTYSLNEVLDNLQLNATPIKE